MAREGEGLQQVVREVPLEGPPGLEPGEGPQGDIQSCRPARLEGDREAQAVRSRGLSRSESHFSKTTPVTVEASRDAGRPRRLLCYSTPKVTVTQLER